MNSLLHYQWYNESESTFGFQGQFCKKIKSDKLHNVTDDDVEYGNGYK